MKSNSSLYNHSVVLLVVKYDEFGKELYVCYIDLQKAFDSVWRKGL